MSHHPCKKPVILVIGSTGTNGRLIVEKLEKHSADVTVRYSSRRQEQVDQWKKEKKDAVILDLDNPLTFGLALHGVDRLILITGYTVAMLTQSKTLIDAAYKAGVQHVVHLGIFADWDTTDPHFVWHFMIETYLKASGLKWTNLHPNMFMENVFAPNFLDKGAMNDFFDGRKVGWVAAEDIAKVAATVLREGPCKHHGKDYWMSTDSLTMAEAGKIISEVTGKPIGVAKKTEQDFVNYVATSPVWNEKWYAEGVRHFIIQIKDGRLGVTSAVRDDVPFVTGEPSLHFREWATGYKDALTKAVSQ
ncbi:NAD(P)H azoreductase-like [Paramacrobiotus metropolitanus]|uniref:NAD(P)H azoreductase-like n=1 Tax=Paramacrobiotus metropolitanus TaxID=2943436 RepID=UPI002445F5D3|nr:NAD(P)H azoreductase-like [Paramacrobiotus metropolitanus]